MQGVSVGQGLLNLGGGTKELEKTKQLLHVNVKFVVDPNHLHLLSVCLFDDVQPFSKKISIARVFPPTQTGAFPILASNHCFAFPTSRQVQPAAVGGDCKAYLVLC